MYLIQSHLVPVLCHVARHAPKCHRQPDTAWQIGQLVKLRRQMATSFAKASTMFAVLAAKYPITQFSSDIKEQFRWQWRSDKKLWHCWQFNEINIKKRRKVKQIWKWDKLSCVGSFCQIVQRCDCADRRGICHQHFKLSVLQIKFRPEKAKYQAGMERGKIERGDGETDIHSTCSSCRQKVRHGISISRPRPWSLSVFT